MDAMLTENRVTYVWLALLALTLGSAGFGETAASALMTSLVVALIVGVKGFLVIRYYMGLAEPGSRLRQVMRLYFVVVPALIVLVTFIVATPG